ncbi:hypothetical protein ABEB36_009752 [Hypothenemus hampei]|uniref:HTH psq-type domain-containing protein n=1 Tax=Hypothenemus hampei TaxID=57062 RepID=A0ABD1EHV7_HYPHA
MPRKYKRKTNRGDIDENAVRSAIKDFSTHMCGLLEASRRYGIKKSTLQSRIKIMKSKALGGVLNFESDSGNESENPNLKTNKYAVNQIFSMVQELDLAEYLKKSSNLHYGLTYRQIRLLSYDFAIANNLKTPESWKTKEIAGWLQLC